MLNLPLRGIIIYTRASLPLPPPPFPRGSATRRLVSQNALAIFRLRSSGIAYPHIHTSTRPPTNKPITWAFNFPNGQFSSNPADNFDIPTSRLIDFNPIFSSPCFYPFCLYWRQIERRSQFNSMQLIRGKNEKNVMNSLGRDHIENYRKVITGINLLLLNKNWNYA